jgi:serine/threonine protein kinase
MFGRFDLLDRIGLGGMAEVWRARVAGVGGFEKILVVKKILPAFAQNKTFVDMLLAEARLCAVLQHTNIVQTYENGEIDGQFYIAMEYVAGPDLFKVLSRATQVGQRISQDLCLFVAAEVAKGLHYAHHARDHYGRPLHIIHRDVSPSNVIISEAGEVKVMDFGVARATPGGQPNEHATRAGVLKGKLGYMSPEQVTGQPFDHRSDIFSLGIILYESLTLKRLFLAKTDLETLVNIRDARLEHKFKKHSYIDDGVRAILRKALARDVGDRYPTAMAMHDDIIKHLFNHKLQVTNSHLSSFIAKLFDPTLSIPSDKLRPPEQPPPATQPQRSATADLPPEPQAPAPANQNPVTSALPGFQPASQSLSFSPEDMRRIRERIAEKRAEHAAGLPNFAVPRRVGIGTPPPQPASQASTHPITGPPAPQNATEPAIAGQRRTSRNAPAAGVETGDGAHGLVVAQAEGSDDQAPQANPATTAPMPRPGKLELDAAAAHVGHSSSGFTATGRAEPVSYTVAALAKATPPAAFRLRAGDGQEFGPLRQANLEAMLRARTVGPDDLVSANDGPWQAIRTLAALQRAVKAIESGTGAPTLHGPLNQWAFVRLVYKMYADRATGCLELRRGDLVKTLYFRRGRAQYIASNQHNELLGPFMVANGFISQANIDIALARAKSTGGRLGDLLVGLNLIKPFQLYQVLERQLRAKFIDAFGWDSGTFAYFDGVVPPGDIVPLDIDPIGVLADGVRDRVPLSVLEPMFQDKLDMPVYRTRNPLISVNTLRLQARESKALSMILAAKTPRESYEECVNNRPQRLALLHVLLLLLQTEVLTFDAERAA